MALQPDASEPCVFVANLHVRKCAGTSVRSMFTHMPEWEQSGMYCSPMSAHASDPNNRAGRHWSETHCDEDMGHFNDGVRELRKQLEPEGCKVISTLLLRNPVEQLADECTSRSTARNLTSHDELPLTPSGPVSAQGSTSTARKTRRGRRILSSGPRTHRRTCSGGLLAANLSCGGRFHRLSRRR